MRCVVAGAALVLCVTCTTDANGAVAGPKGPGMAHSVRPRRVVVSRDGLVVTEGALGSGEGGRLRVESEKMRAVAPAFRRPAAGLRFTYLGPTAAVSRLASGEERRQLGLKLNARDGCNLLYVMWRLAPVPGVVVQVKENPGKEISADCGALGYRTVRPAFHKGPPPLVPGVEHELVARLEGRALVVEIDGAKVWEGQVDEAAAAIQGPIGVRTDNVRCELELIGEE